MNHKLTRAIQLREEKKLDETFNLLGEYFTEITGYPAKFIVRRKHIILWQLQTSPRFNLTADLNNLTVELAWTAYPNASEFTRYNSILNNPNLGPELKTKIEQAFTEPF